VGQHLDLVVQQYPGSCVETIHISSKCHCPCHEHSSCKVLATHRPSCIHSLQECPLALQPVHWLQSGTQCFCSQSKFHHCNKWDPRSRNSLVYFQNACCIGEDILQQSLSKERIFQQSCCNCPAGKRLICNGQDNHIGRRAHNFQGGGT